MSRVAAVVIGCNEGPRLPRSLRSVLPHFDPVVYVDSGSTDGSPEVARDLGVEVVHLDMSIPFTFGRARNAGVRRVLDLDPNIPLFQFVDSDSEIHAGWCAAAAAAIDRSPRLGAVHGRVRERHASTSVYDRLYDLEFDPRAGERPDCIGGMAMVRAAAFREVGGYAEHMQTFEDHEISFRLRSAGWEVRWLDDEMALHEAGMTTWRQWWRRERRAGHARAQMVSWHGLRGEHFARPLASICFWGALLPASALGATLFSPPLGFLLSLGYPVLFFRIYRRLRGRQFRPSDAALYAAARVVGKAPQLSGVMSFLAEKRSVPVKPTQSGYGERGGRP